MINEITFKSKLYTKNYDILIFGDNIITECDGIISKTRIKENKSSIQIGEYGMSIWNLNLSWKLNIDILRLIESHRSTSSYDDLLFLINKTNEIDISKYNKLIIVHTMILQKEYRKKNISQEFTEMLYRDYYDEKNIILVYAKPFQYIPMDYDYYTKRKTVTIKNNHDNKEMNAFDYYDLNEFIEKKDAEKNEYRLFSILSKCGFTRLGETNLFKLKEEEVLNNLKIKYLRMKSNFIGK